MAAGNRRAGITARRKLLFAIVAVALLYLAWAWHARLAFTAGIAGEQMDWNGDGQVTEQEMLQSWYAVSVRSTREGRRECHAFYWRGQEAGEPIRVDCRTSFSTPEE